MSEKETVNRKKRRYRGPLNWKKGVLIGLAALVVITGAARLFGRDRKVEQSVLDSGLAYIQSMESMDVSTVKSQISDIRKEEKRQLLAEGKLSVWDQFDEYVVLGDSRGVGFSYYKFLDEDRVMAEAGATIRNVADHLEQIRTLQPKEIFMCYGLNDVSIGYWDTPEAYAAEFKQVMESIWEAAPDAKIYVSSILIARDPAFERSEKWRKIPDFNTALQAMCNENGYTYVDNSGICDEYAELWDIDGIHVQRDFYQYWATNLIAEVEDDEE